jgi:regulator of replication initiation timing
MEENRQEYDNYDNTEFEEDYTPRPDFGKSIRGYRIVIIILSVILVAISALYFGIHRQQMLDNELLRADRDSIQNDLGRLMEDYDNLHVANDSISASLDIERGRADSLMNQLRKERRWSLAKIKQYEKEVGTLRTVMRGYLHQIDSLNSLNQKLITENISYRKEISSATLRAEMAEEKAAELDNKVRAGAVIKARGIRLTGLNARNKEVSRIRNAERVRVDFVLTANELTTPGNKAVYMRLTSPDGYVLTTEAMPTFEYEGERLSYSAMREVDYQNQDLEVGIYFDSSGFAAGTYLVQLYCDGYMIGSAEIAMR